VRVVTPEEVNEIDLAANPSPAEASTTGQGPADEVRDVEAQSIDNTELRIALTRVAAERQVEIASPAPTASSTPPADEPKSWLRRMVAVLADAFATVAAAARVLIA
jgi:hypothetical protein